jgi:hypothetical protein
MVDYYPYFTVGDESWYLTPKGTDTHIALSTPAWNVTTFGGSPRALPPLRGDNQIVPYRPGREPRGKVADARTISFMMWVTGADPTNEYLLSDDQVLSFNDNFHTLRTTVWQSHNSSITLTRRWRLTTPTGVITKVAEAEAQIGDVMEPTMTGRTRATFSMDLFLADPYFWGGSVTVGPGLVNNPGDDIAEYKGMFITLGGAGTLSNGPISLTVTGGGTLDCENFTTSGGLPLSGISHSGSKSWFALMPGDNNVTWSGTGSASITFRAPYV